MIAFPNAKINLGLNIISKRSDGYHEIETCFYPVPICDVLEINEASQLSFTSTGLDIPGSTASNLCLKAYRLIAEAYNVPQVAIHLHKVIPMGAGLGGGSSDGAFMLKLLNEKFQLAIDDEQLENFAAQLGSDCPFFIKNKPAFGTGTGTSLTGIDLSLKGKYIVFDHPKIHVSTQEAYGGVSPGIPGIRIPEILKQATSTWKDALINDFEKPIFLNHPKIKKAKNDLYELGAVYACMSGSGSTVFGLFDEEPDNSGDFQTYQLQ